MIHHLHQMKKLKSIISPILNKTRSHCCRISLHFSYHKNTLMRKVFQRTWEAGPLSQENWGRNEVIKWKMPLPLGQAAEVTCFVCFEEEKAEGWFRHRLQLHHSGQWRGGSDLFSLMTPDRTRGNVMKLCERRFR